MRKAINLVLIFAALLTISTLDVQAQTSARIQFAKGKSSATIKGSTGKYGTTYFIRAKSGQKLIIDLTPSAKVGIKVETSGRYGEMTLLREESGGRYEVGLEETGDYTIFVGSPDGKPVSFTLTVRVEKLADV